MKCRFLFEEYQLTILCEWSYLLPWFAHVTINISHCERSIRDLHLPNYWYIESYVVYGEAEVEILMCCDYHQSRFLTIKKWHFVIRNIRNLRWWFEAMAGTPRLLYLFWEKISRAWVGYTYISNNLSGNSSYCICGLLSRFQFCLAQGFFWASWKSHCLLGACSLWPPARPPYLEIKVSTIFAKGSVIPEILAYDLLYMKKRSCIEMNLPVSPIQPSHPVAVVFWYL